MFTEDRQPRHVATDRRGPRVAIALPHASRADVEGAMNDPASFAQVLWSLWGFAQIGGFVWLTFLGGLLSRSC